MMKNILRISMALVIALTLLMSSVSTVSAAPPVKGKIAATADIVSITWGEKFDVLGQNIHCEWSVSGAASAYITVSRNQEEPFYSGSAASGSGTFTTWFGGQLGDQYTLTVIPMVSTKNKSIQLTAFAASDTAVVGPRTFLVTFHATFDLDGVSIQVYSDSGLQTPIGSALTTAGDGWATIYLENGTYYYKATMDGFTDLTDSFTVSGGAITINFSMTVPEYTVTFTVTDGSTYTPAVNLGIDIYDSDDYKVDTVYTNSSGVATIQLVNGYYHCDFPDQSLYHYLGDPVYFEVYNTGNTVDITVHSS